MLRSCPIRTTNHLPRKGDGSDNPPQSPLSTGGKEEATHRLREQDCIREQRHHGRCEQRQYGLYEQRQYGLHEQRQYGLYEQRKYGLYKQRKYGLYKQRKYGL